MVDDGHTRSARGTSRRSVLKSSSLLGALTLIGGATIAGAASTSATPAGEIGLLPEASDGLRFFTEKEARTVEAVVRRLAGGGAHGHGAVAADVTRYLDHRLASAEGDVEPSRQEVYERGVPALDRYSQTRFGSLFADLPQQRQDDVLRILDATWRRDENRSGDGRATEQEMDQAQDVFGDVSPGEFFATLGRDVTATMHRRDGRSRVGLGSQSPQQPHAHRGVRM